MFLIVPVAGAGTSRYPYIWSRTSVGSQSNVEVVSAIVTTILVWALSLS
jgi:hypothetical protein